jgi:hypothetical protein
MRANDTLLSGLADLSFTHLITVRWIKVAYALSLVALLLCGAMLAAEAVQAMRYAMARGLGMLLGALLIVGGGAIGSRIACELVIVVFRLSEHAAEMADQTATIATNTAMGGVSASLSRK